MGKRRLISVSLLLAVCVILTRCTLPKESFARAAVRGIVPPRMMCALPDQPRPARRPVVNIDQDGRTFCGDVLWHDPERTPDSYAGMLDLLVFLKQQPGVAKRRVVIDREDVDLVEDPILVRADRNTEWHYIGQFMWQCARVEAAFWKIELGVRTANGSASAKVPAYLPKHPVGIDEDPPVEELRITIHCREWGTERPRPRTREFELDGHQIEWMAGPVRVDSEEEFSASVSEFLDESEGGPEGGEQIVVPLRRIVIEPRFQTTFGDAMRTADIVLRSAGSRRPTIRFDGGQWSRRQARRGYRKK